MGRPDLEVYALEGSHVYLRNKDASADAINLRVGDKVVSLSHSFLATEKSSVCCFGLLGCDPGGVLQCNNITKNWL